MLPAILVFLSAATVAFCNDHDPHQPPSLVDILAHSVTDPLLKSKVIENAIPFSLEYPEEMFYEVGMKLLELSSIEESERKEIAEVAAEAAGKVANLTSDLYFRTVGYEIARFLDYYGFLTDDNVVYLAFMIVTSVELQACIIGADDAESVTTATVYGLYEILNALGLVSPQNTKTLFYVFANELSKQAGLCKSH